jgi:hypothetical protein
MNWDQWLFQHQYFFLNELPATYNFCEVECTAVDVPSVTLRSAFSSSIGVRPRAMKIAALVAEDLNSTRTKFDIVGV